MNTPKIAVTEHRDDVAATWKAVAKHGMVELTHRNLDNMVLMTVELYDALITQAELGEVVCDDGWIVWSGGDNPAPGKMVEIRCASYPARDILSARSDEFYWKNDGYLADIIRYRVID